MLRKINNFLNGKKTVIGLVMLGLGFALDSEELKWTGASLAGIGGAHKAYKRKNGTTSK